MHEPEVLKIDAFSLRLQLGVLLHLNNNILIGWFSNLITCVKSSMKGK
jgi:hypothetical protein